MASLICEYCGKEYEGQISNGRDFCSEKCHRIWRVDLREGRRPIGTRVKRRPAETKVEKEEGTTEPSRLFKYDPTERMGVLLTTTNGMLRTLEKLTFYVKIIAVIMVMGIIASLVGVVVALSMWRPTP